MHLIDSNSRRCLSRDIHFGAASSNASVVSQGAARLHIILVGKAFWTGLLDWLKKTLVAEGMAGVGDMDLIQLIDEPEDVVEAIFNHYEETGFELTPAERKVQLYL